MTELDVRIEVLRSILMTPHGKLAAIDPIHVAGLERDPLFYGHMGVWYQGKGEVRDHKVLFIAHLLTSEFPEHREAGWMLLQSLPPYLVAAVLDHAKQTIGKSPRILRSAIAGYLADIEAHPTRFDRAALRSRKDLKHLYASLRLKPGPRAQQILFAEKPPEDSPLFQVKMLARTSDPEEQALLIIVHRIPYTVAVGAIKQVTPSILVALLDVMTPQEVINHLKALSQHGAFNNPEVKALVEEKLKGATTDKRVSTLKATKAMAHVALDASTQRVLTEVTDKRVAQMTAITRPTALLVDKSGSMDQAIELAQEVAALISAVCRDFRVVMFDTTAHVVPLPTETTRSAFEAAFKMYRANGGTSIGAPMARLTKDGQRVEEIVIITDGGENSQPYFKDAYEGYVKAMGNLPHVVIVGLNGYIHHFTAGLEAAGIPVTEWVFQGDYYSLPNLLPLLALPGHEELVEQILAVPLPKRTPERKTA